MWKALSEYLGRMTSHLSGHRLDDFVKLNKLGEGTYGVVFKVSNIVCLLVFKTKLKTKFKTNLSQLSKRVTNGAYKKSLKINSR